MGWLWICAKFLPSNSSFLSGSCLSSSCLSSSCVCIQCMFWLDARTRKNTQEHGTKIPQLDLTFPPKEFTEYGHAYCTLRLDMMTSSCTTPAKHHTRPHDHEDFAKKQSHLPKVFLSSVTCSSVQNKLMRRAI